MVRVVGLWFLGLCVLAAAVLVCWNRIVALNERRALNTAIAEHVSRGDAAATAGRHEVALVAYEAARALAPTDPTLQQALLALRVRIAAEAPDLLAAADLPVVEYALDVTSPDDAVAYTARATLAARRGQEEASRDALGKALQSNPKYAPALLAFGVSERRAGRLPESLALFEKARGVAPEDPAVLNNLGVAYTELGRFDEARASLESAVLKRDSGPTRLNLANALLGLGRSKEAIPHVRAAVALQPESSIALARLGAILSATGEPVQAEDAFRRSLALERSPETAYALALALQAQKRFAEAAEVLRGVLEVNPKSPDAAYQLGATLEAMGDGKGAVEVLRHYIAIATGNPAEDKRRGEVERLLAAAAQPIQPTPAPPEPLPVPDSPPPP